MKKKYSIPQSHSLEILVDGNILNASPINKFNAVKDEGEEQYSQQMKSPTNSLWDGMNKD